MTARSPKIKIETRPAPYGLVPFQIAEMPRPANANQRSPLQKMDAQRRYAWRRYYEEARTKNKMALTQLLAIACIRRVLAGDIPQHIKSELEGMARALSKPYEFVASEEVKEQVATLKPEKGTKSGLLCDRSAHRYEMCSTTMAAIAVRAVGATNDGDGGYCCEGCGSSEMLLHDGDGGWYYCEACERREIHSNEMLLHDGDGGYYCEACEKQDIADGLEYCEWCGQTHYYEDKCRH